MPKSILLTRAPLRAFGFARHGALAVLASVSLLACGGECPHGTTQVGEICRLNNGVDAQTAVDAGNATDSTSESSATPSGGRGARTNGNSRTSGAAGGGAGGAGGKSGDSTASGAGGDAQHAGASGGSAGTGGMNKPTDVTAGKSGGGGDANTAPRCGDGVKGVGETCDGADCPTSCPAANGCVVMKLTGSAAMCDAECVASEIKINVAGDGCCPAGADASKDSDCPAKCGDGIVDANEKCEPSSTDNPCPTSCDDNDPCTKDTLTGSAAQCTAVCTNTRITRAVSGDMCCPSGANANTDNDCKPKCGNGVVEAGEKCDGDCPTRASCDDGNPCTDDALEGTASSCTAKCAHPRSNVGADCGGGKMCSASGTCELPPSRCGDGVVTGTEECDPASAGYNAFSCSPDCKKITHYTKCGPGWPACLEGTVCNLGLCSKPCSSTADCDTVAGFPGLGVQCPVPRGTICVISCSTNQDCPPGALCNGGAVCDGT